MSNEHKRITIVYSSTNEKSINDVIHNIIKVHEKKQNSAIHNIVAKE